MAADWHAGDPEPRLRDFLTSVDEDGRYLRCPECYFRVRLHHTECRDCRARDLDSPASLVRFLALQGLNAKERYPRCKQAMLEWAQESS